MTTNPTLLQELATCLDTLYARAHATPGKTVGYGNYNVDDPRDFVPDHENFDEEIAWWKEACAHWEAGEPTNDPIGCATLGGENRFGLGTYLMDDWDEDDFEEVPPPHSVPDWAPDLVKRCVAEYWRDHVPAPLAGEGR